VDETAVRVRASEIGRVLMGVPAQPGLGDNT
jgi:hypothetical protein